MPETESVETKDIEFNADDLVGQCRGVRSTLAKGFGGECRTHGSSQRVDRRWFEQDPVYARRFELSGREWRAVAGHQNDGQIRPNAPELTRECKAGHSRHGLVSNAINFLED
jgi:hypothetical protein